MKETIYGYNNPDRGTGFASMTVKKGILTVNSSKTYRLNTVSNVKNILGAHEYYGHFVKGYCDEKFNHHKAYEYQFNHKTWNNVTIEIKK